MKIIALLILIVLPAIPMGWAGYRMGDRAPVKIEDSPVQKKKEPRTVPGKKERTNNEAAVLEDLSERFGVRLETLHYLRHLNHGYEELIPALIIAREAQIETGQVLDLRMNGKTWRWIAEQYSIELKPLNREVIETLKPIRQQVPKSAITEKPRNRVEP